jgi:hypothetical protein
MATNIKIKKIVKNSKSICLYPQKNKKQFIHFKNAKEREPKENIGYCNAEQYKCPPNEQYKY